MNAALELPERVRSSRLAPAELVKLDLPTPYLLLDLDAVERAYRAVAGALPGVTIRYAVKCNPDERILRRLDAAGSAFEIASCAELETLAGLGVRAEDVLFSNRYLRRMRLFQVAGRCQPAVPASCPDGLLASCCLPTRVGVAGPATVTDGLTVPHTGVCRVSEPLPATTSSIISTKAARLRAAFTSRSSSSPQALQRYTRSLSDSVAFAIPQPEQVFDDG